MKIANLVIAIIYTLFYLCIFLSGFIDGEAEIVLGVIMLSPPVVLLWVNYNFFLKKY